MSDLMQFAKVDGRLAPVEQFARDAMEKVGDGEIVTVTFKRLRNPGFHRKFFALIRLAYDLWKPPEAQLFGQPATKSFERFRKDLIIAAGYYEVQLGSNGPVLEAKSIAWGNMGEETFNELYESVVAVLSQGVLPGITREDADRLADEVISQGF